MITLPGLIALCYLPGMYQAPQVHLSGRLVNVASGKRGTMQTLRAMRAFVDADTASLPIIQAAVSTIYTTPPRDQFAEVNALFEMVRSGIRYTKDAWGVETLARPATTLARRVGDCDDMATLFATLCQSVGYPARFVVVGFDDSGEFDHVYVEVCINGQWVACDTTEQYPMGWEPPNPTIKFVERV